MTKKVLATFRGVCAALYARKMASKLVCVSAANALNLGMTFSTVLPLMSRYLNNHMRMLQEQASDTTALDTEHAHDLIPERDDAFIDHPAQSAGLLLQSSADKHTCLCPC